jgi:hypothetical protein
MSVSKKNILLAITLLGLIVLGMQACTSDPPVVASKGSVISVGPTYTPTFTFTPCNSILGDSAIEASNGNYTGTIYANRYYFSGTTVKRLSIYTSGTGQFRLAIYSDNASVTAPATLIVDSGAVSTTVSPGWNTATITPLTLSSGYYWLALQESAGVNIYYNSSAAVPMPYIYQTFGAFPVTYAGSAPCTCSAFSMYATYCP